MKIVQSLWSKPRKKNGAGGFAAADSCGWADRKYNYFSWALSALQLRKYYDKLELVTDREGAELLINKLELPYTEVKVVLDVLNQYPADLFAVGKIYTYSLQKEPFLHIDGDAIIWEKFSDELERSPLFCQSREEGGFFDAYYSKSFYSMVRHLRYFPEILHESVAKYGRIRAINAGIIGGNDLDFFRAYTSGAFEFIDRNLEHLDKIEIESSNAVFEQFLFKAMAEQQGKDIRYLLTDMDAVMNDIVDFSGVPSRWTFIHLYGEHKRVKYLLDCLEYRLQREHPAHYYKILNLLRTNQI